MWHWQGRHCQRFGLEWMRDARSIGSSVGRRAQGSHNSLIVFWGVLVFVLLGCCVAFWFACFLCHTYMIPLVSRHQMRPFVHSLLLLVGIASAFEVPANGLWLEGVWRFRMPTCLGTAIVPYPILGAVARFGHLVHSALLATPGAT